MQDDLVWGGCNICNGRTICRHQLNIWYAHVWTQSIGASWRINHKLWKVKKSCFGRFFLLTADQSFVCDCITNAYFFIVNSQCQHSGWLVICCDRILAFGSSQLGATRCPMESFSLYQLRYLETSSPTNLVVGCETWLLLSWNVPTKFPEGPTLCVYPHASTWVFQSHSRTSFV